jgi:hypothetical protein
MGGFFSGTLAILSVTLHRNALNPCILVKISLCFHKLCIVVTQNLITPRKARTRNSLEPVTAGSRHRFQGILFIGFRADTV